MSKYLRVTLLALIVAALALSALPATAQSPVRIRIFVGVGTGYRPDQLDGQKALAEEWNAANPDIQITFDFNDNTTALDVLKTQIAGDNAPDIVGPAGIRTFSEIGNLFLDLTPLIERDMAELKTDDYDEAVLNLFKQAGGKTLALALGVFPSFMWVNEDLFAAAEVPLPPKQYGQPYITADGKELPWDWDTVALIAKDLTRDANGVYATESGFDASKTEVWGFGDWWLDLRNVAVRFGGDNGIAADGKTATFNSAPYLAAALWYHDRIHKDQSVPEVAEEGSIAQGASPFESGKLAMWYSHSWYNCCMVGAKFKTGIYPAPAVPGTNGTKVVAPMHADTFAIPVGSKNQEAAWKVLKWLNSAEIAARLAPIYGLLPARKSIRAEWEAQAAVQWPYFDVPLVLASTAYADAPNHEGFLPNQSEVKKVYDVFWNNLRTDPNLDVKAGLDALNATIQGIYEGIIPPTPTPTN